MAEIPPRTTVFPTWAVIQENLATGVAKIDPVQAGRNLGRAETAGMAGVPTNIGSDTMPIIGLALPADLWGEHHSVTMNGSEYPEQITASVPAGKTLTVNAGQRWLETSVNNGAPTFQKELPDDAVFISVSAGGTLNLNADKTGDTAQTAGIKNSAGVFQQYPLGGRNVAVISGAGKVTADMGNYGNNVFITARESDVKLGNGIGYYGASGASAVGHKVTGGSKADVFEYNFTSGVPATIGANKFNGGVGSTEVNDVDSIQLRRLPSGSKVTANVSAVRGSGVFKDSDVTLTIKNPAGTTIGTIAATNLNYVHIIYADGSVQGFAPQSLGTGGTQTYNIGTTAPAAAPAARSSNLDGVSPLNIPAIINEKAPTPKLM